MKPAPTYFGDSHGFRCWRGPGAAMAGAHSHLEIEANLVHRGSIVYLFGGQRVAVEAGEWAIFWGSVPHQLVVREAETEISWFTLPLSRFLGWNLPPALTQGLLSGQIIKESVDDFDALHFERWRHDLESGEAARVPIVELEMQARLLRLALASRPSGAVGLAPTRGEIGPIEKMAAFMAQHFAEPITSEDVARSAGIHPNYAMNLFKRGFGLSLGQFLTRTRLSQVQRLLATSDRNVLDIALSCGFGSASRFHVAFKKECGQSPAEFRQSLRG